LKISKGVIENYSGEEKMTFTAIKKISIPTKQEALYFDQILLKPNESDHPIDREISKHEVENMLNDLTFKYLEDQGVVAIKRFSDYFGNDVQMKFWLHRNAPKGKEVEKENTAQRTRLKKKLLRLNDEGKREVENYIDFLYLQHEIREMSLLLREQKGLDAVPLLDYDPWTPKVNIQNMKLGAVRVILNKIPVPAEDEVPWEQIIDIRQDEEARHKRTGLRIWMRKVVTTATTLTEISEALEYKLHEEEEWYKLNKIKYKKGFIHAIFFAPFEFLANLAVLNVNKSIDSVFSIAQAKIDLDERELNNPGREVAYIRYLQEKFG